MIIIPKVYIYNNNKTNKHICKKVYKNGVNS